MGIVAKQSARNSVILHGLLLGAVNTMFVLPKAFGSFEEGWGLLRILVAWGTILAQVLALGTPSAILRFLPAAKDGRREASMLSTLCLLPAFALALAGVLSTFASDDLLLTLDADAGYLLQGRVGAFLFMAAAYLAMLLLRAVLTHRLRTVVILRPRSVVERLVFGPCIGVLARVDAFETFFNWFLYSYAAAVS